MPPLSSFGDFNQEMLDRMEEVDYNNMPPMEVDNYSNNGENN